MKKILYTLLITGGLLSSSCTDWLTVYPNNEQVTDDYWKSEEDVEAVLASGYYYMRQSVSNFIRWGELRAGSIYMPYTSSAIQTFQLIPNSSYISWETLYKVINMANSVLEYAPQVMEEDEGYVESVMNSHLCEAYFMRALMYFYLVRNWKEVPLVLSAYVDDTAPMSLAKSSEDDIVAQIKSDLLTAIDIGAAKEFYDSSALEGINAWENKGRGTIWAIYALMADVCLWSEDWDGCIQYADMLLNSSSSYAPAFITSSAADSHESWFRIYNPGNSSESIFELQFSYSLSQTSGSPSSLFSVTSSADYRYTTAMTTRLIEEANEVAQVSSSGGIGRAWYGACVFDTDESGSTNYSSATAAYIWKYNGGENSNGDYANVRTNSDANFIIYRVADVMLMKAEALIWQGGDDNYASALDIINQIRERAGLADSSINPNETSELEMLTALLNERDIEFAAEGKRWYDLIRYGRSKDFRYFSTCIALVTENNQSARAAWISSVLNDEYGWYLPIDEDEIASNTLLTQNPYYSGY